MSKKKTDKRTGNPKAVFTEEQIAEFAGFCATMGDQSEEAPICQACQKGDGYPKDMFAYCTTLVAVAEKAKADKKVIKIGGRVRPKYVDFKDLKKHVTEAPSTGMSMVLNKLILEGKYTMQELLTEAGHVQYADFEAEGKKGGKHFTGVGDIKKHINWLADRGWVITFTKDGKTKLTGYTPGEQVKTTFPVVKKKEEKKAEEKKAA